MSPVRNDSGFCKWGEADRLRLELNSAEVGGGFRSLHCLFLEGKLTNLGKAVAV